MAAATEHPSVAVVIPTYNQAGYLPLSVESAFAQRYPGPLEVWVVDDASTDATAEVVTRLQVLHPDLRSIRQSVNRGVAINASTALAAPEADLIVRLDSDDLLEPGFVATLSALMVAHPDAAYGHCSVREIDQTGALGRTRTLARRTGFVDADDALRASLSGYKTVANILMFRKSAVASVDYYRGRPDFVEDYDLSVRLADAGFGNVYTSDVLARYRVWDDPRGIRARRKGMQLDGYRRIFDEAMVPAFERRGWNLGDVRRRRARLAAHHAHSCFAPQYTDAESADLLTLLHGVGDGVEVRARVALCRRGHAPAVAQIDELPAAVKRWLKAAAGQVARSR